LIEEAKAAPSKRHDPKEAMKSLVDIYKYLVVSKYFPEFACGL